MDVRVRFKWLCTTILNERKLPNKMNVDSQTTWKCTSISNGRWLPFEADLGGHLKRIPKSISNTSLLLFQMAIGLHFGDGMSCLQYGEWGHTGSGPQCIGGIICCQNALYFILVWASMDCFTTPYNRPRCSYKRGGERTKTKHKN